MEKAVEEKLVQGVFDYIEWTRHTYWYNIFQNQEVQYYEVDRAEVDEDGNPEVEVWVQLADSDGDTTAVTIISNDFYTEVRKGGRLIQRNSHK